MGIASSDLEVKAARKACSGCKQSGFGREIWRYVLELYTHTKPVCARLG